MRSSDANLCESPPGVDVALQGLVSHVSLPLESSVTFRDPMDRQVDIKRIYYAADLSKALKTWLSNIEAALNSEMDSVRIVIALEELNLSADFLVEALVDLVKLLARSMANVVTAKRALWLFL